jgi:NitT/TauT family transport system ATP-binding protein
MEPIPDAGPGEIIGLLEYLNARQGKEEVFRIASDTGRRFDQVLSIVEGAELLDFVDTPKRMVVLEPLGKRFVQAEPGQRQALWRERLLTLHLFREIYEALQRAPDHCLDEDFVKESIIMHLPQENYETVFQTFIRWAWYGNLFVYDEFRGEITLP